jgi:NTE family protein
VTPPARPEPGPPEPQTAFVLGGGGVLGAHEVGMLEALAEADISPGLVLGTSIGAVNGALFAADPGPGGVARLRELWSGATFTELSSGALLRRAGTLARSRTHLEPFSELRRRLRAVLPVSRVEELKRPFQCVAASIERAAEHWFDAGPLAEVLLASCAVPGLLPPVKIGDEHFIDGGIVNSIPVSRAVALGAHRIFVLQVGRIERPLQPPRWPWEVGLVAFEVARRHRFAHDLHSLPADIEVHVLPTGGSAAPAYNDIAGLLALRRARRVSQWIDTARDATSRYLEEHGCRPQPSAGLSQSR